MRHTCAQYAQSLHDALEGAKNNQERREMIRRFVFMLRNDRASGNLQRILAAFERYYLKRRGLRNVKIESPSGLDEQTRKKIAALTGEKTIISETVRLEFLAGIRITIDNELLIDASGKRRLEVLLR